MEEDMSQAKRDGRNIRWDRSHLLILKATKEILKAGVMRPTAPMLAKAAGVSIRTVFQHWKSVDSLLEECICDGLVREQIANLVCCFGGPPAGQDDQLAMVKAIVLGRL